MWHDQPFSQRSKIIGKAVGVGVGGSSEREGGWVGLNLKKFGGRQYRGVTTPLPTMDTSVS